MPWMWNSERIIDAESVTNMNVADIRGSSKRTADSAGLDENEQRLKKIRHEGQCAGLNVCRRV